MGSELLRLDGKSPEHPIEARHAALAAGFAVASRGQEAIRAALARLAADADGPLDEPAKAFGKLFRDMRELHQDDETFAVFAELLRDSIFDVWPIAAGEDVLGRALGQRRLHSVVTAAAEIGVSERRLHPFLVEHDVLRPDELRPYSRTIFDAARHASLLQVLPLLVKDSVMRASIGATEAELLALEQDGILTPRSRLPGIRLRWLVADGLALVDELSRLGGYLTNDIGKWETIQMAKSRSGVSVGRIIGGIRKGEIRLRMSPGNRDYHGFEVCRADFGQIS